ncbi:MAG: flagellar M-ring protein FliF [Desulfobacterales bacterium]|nr:flagellar M-ring protein FliF [Desulfobacterales bacterium]
MNPVLEQTANIYKALPASRKFSMAGVLMLVVAGFVAIFFWANKVDFQPAYTNLTPEDAAEVVQKLKAQRIPYQLTGNGSIVMVPSDRVYDVRLDMAKEGVPKGAAVGFEIFDETDFGTTEFVQKMNYQRALQGELSRTIKQFREIEDARVMIVMEKESVFVEDSRPPSASVLLKLRSKLSKEKTDAVVHLVASSIEGLTAERITVVDTTGMVLSRGGGDEEKVGSQANTQFDYKINYEQTLAKQVQTMLEKIVGEGKAIVRVTADMDFNKVEISEEIFDPDAQVARSSQKIVELSQRGGAGEGEVSTVNPQAAASGEGTSPSEKESRQDETTNYEINKTVRHTSRPVGAITRLSVAAVLDGKYTEETDAGGKIIRTYVERTPAELDQFKTIVQNAMGYDVDRADQVTVESFRFSTPAEMEMPEASGIDWILYAKQYKNIALNLLLVMLIFMFVVRPLIKTIKEVKTAVVEPALIAAEEERKMVVEQTQRETIPESTEMLPKDRASNLAKQDIDKSANLVKGWLNEE